MGIERFMYTGKRAVVVGAASGIGAAVASLAGELGAEVIGVDMKPVDGVAASHQCDLRDRSQIDSLLDRVGGPIDALFVTAGLPGAPFSMADTMLVNFIGARHLVEATIGRGLMPRGSSVVLVSSLADIGWRANLPAVQEFLSVTDFDDAARWVVERSEDPLLGDGYNFSKMIMAVYVMSQAARLNREHGVRINATSPGPTRTQLTPMFEAKSASAGRPFAEVLVEITGHGYMTPEEQAYPIVWLNSTAAALVSGTVTYVDTGASGAMQTGGLWFAPIAKAD